MTTPVYRRKSLLSFCTVAKILILIAAFFVKTSLFSQKHSYAYEKISTEIERVEKGLSQSSVRTLFQDSYGFIWIGTWSGLNRFDGIAFKTLLPDIENPENSISNPVINALAEDKSGFLWIGTEGGLNRLNIKTFEIKHYFNQGDNVFSDTIRALYFDNDFLWVGSRHGIVLLNTGTDSLVYVHKISGEKINTGEVRIIKPLSDKIMMLGTENGMQFIDRETLTCITEYGSLRLSNASVLSLLKINDSIVLIGTEGGINILNIYNKKITAVFASEKPDSLTGNVITAMMLDSDSNIWVATSGGGVLWLHYHKDGKMSFEKISAVGIRSDISTGKLKDEEYFYSLLQSKDGTIWLGSAWNGIYKLKKETNIFKKFSKTKSSGGLSDNHIWAFCDDGDNLWIGTEKGVNIYNKSTHTIRYITKNGKRGYRLTSDKIRSIFKDSQGNFWIGTYKEGLNKYFPADGRIQWYKKDADSLHYIPDNTVWRIVEDDKKNLWIATHNGLLKKNLITGKTKLYKNNPKDKHSLSSNVVYNLYFDRLGNLWVATFNGLNMYNTENDNFIVFKHDKNNVKTLNTNRIFYIYQDDSLDYWIGTIGGGLNKMKYKTYETDFYTTREGLPDNTVYAILPDDYGNLWISTNNGISAFNIQNKTFVNYTVNDGLISNEFNFGAALKDHDGNLYFGGMSGFNVLKPNDLIKSNNSTKVVVSEFWVNDGPVYYGIKDAETIKLKYFQNTFSIRFSLLDFNKPLKDLYRYKLTGVNDEWKNLPAGQPVLNFSKLQPGTYHLLIKGLNSTGIWTSKPTDIKIVIEKAFYNRLWVRLLMVFILATILFLIIRNRIKRIQYKQKAERQLLELERQTLRLQMNPHFIFNTLNSIQNYILKNDVDKSIGYLSKFSKLMRMMLNFSRRKLISLDDEIQMLRAYLELENLRHSKGFDFSVEVEPSLETEFIGIPPMIVQPFVENAVIHGIMPLKERRGMLKVRFEQSGVFIKVTITDNGVGRKGEKTKTGNHKPSGMLITQKRLELINKISDNNKSLIITDIVDEKGNPAGTKVEIRILFTETEIS